MHLPGAVLEPQASPTHALEHLHGRSLIPCCPSLPPGGFSSPLPLSTRPPSSEDTSFRKHQDVPGQSNHARVSVPRAMLKLRWPSEDIAPTLQGRLLEMRVKCRFWGGSEVLLF